MRDKKKNKVNKIAVVTGASSGIGKATAEYLAGRGWTVYGLARREIKDEKICGIVCDVTDEVAVGRAFEEIYAKEGRIDALVNNAGMGISGEAEYIPAEKSKKLYELNLIAVSECSRLALPYLKKTKGKIVNVSSIAAIIPIPFQTAYSASKAAVNSFTEALRLEVEPLGVKVCAVMPGDTKTGFTDARDKTDASADYGDRLNGSVKKMEKDERGGKSPVSVAKAIYKNLSRKNPPPLKAVGFEYKAVCFLRKILPERLLLFIVKKIYG